PNGGTIDGNVSVSGGGGGAGKVVFQDLQVSKNIGIMLGNGGNEVTMRRTFVMPHVFETKLSITTGNGFDAIKLEECLISSFTKVNTGGGSDTLAIDATEFKNDC